MSFNRLGNDSLTDIAFHLLDDKKALFHFARASTRCYAAARAAFIYAQSNNLFKTHYVLIEHYTINVGTIGLFKSQTYLVTEVSQESFERQVQNWLYGVNNKNKDKHIFYNTKAEAMLVQKAKIIGIQPAIHPVLIGKKILNAGYYEAPLLIEVKSLPTANLQLNNTFFISAIFPSKYNIPSEVTNNNADVSNIEDERKACIHNLFYTKLEVKTKELKEILTALNQQHNVFEDEPISVLANVSKIKKLEKQIKSSPDYLEYRMRVLSKKYHAKFSLEDNLSAISIEQVRYMLIQQIKNYFLTALDEILKQKQLPILNKLLDIIDSPATYKTYMLQEAINQLAKSSSRFFKQTLGKTLEQHFAAVFRSYNEYLTSAHNKQASMP